MCEDSYLPELLPRTHSKPPGFLVAVHESEVGAGLPVVYALSSDAITGATDAVAGAGESVHLTQIG